MRRLLVLALGALVLLTAGWAVAPAASACSCMPATAAAQLDRADVAFTGTLVSREVLRPDPAVSSSIDPAVHVFAVDRVLKGTPAARQTVVSAASSASCGLELTGDGPFLVLATDPPGGPAGELTADLCGGTGPVPPELAAEQPAPTGPGAGDGQALTGGGPPDRSLDVPAGTYEDPSTLVFVLLLGGLLALTVLVGGLAAFAGRRTDRRALRVVVLTRD